MRIPLKSGSDYSGNIFSDCCENGIIRKDVYKRQGVHGAGDAIVFTNGKVIKGTWKRESDEAPNLFMDEDGNEIIFNQGKTWICNIWKEYSEYMKYELSLIHI